MRQILILIVVAVTGVTAYLFRADLPVVGGLFAPAPAAAPAAPPAPPVTVATPMVRELVEYDEFSGRFQAVEEVALRARVSGYLDEVRVADGSVVEAGDVLFVIDQRPFVLALEAAEAELARAHADLDFYRRELERGFDLVSRNAVSRSVVDDRIRQVATAEAAIASSEVAVAEAELDLDFTTIRAPFVGRISDRRVDVGNLVDSETVLTTIVRLDPLEFEFDITEDVQLAYRRAILAGELPPLDQEESGAAVRLVDDETEWPYPARITFVDNVVDQGSGTVRVHATISNDDGFILPGQFGYVRIPGSPRYEAILVPDDAIVSDQANRVLFTVDDDNMVVPKIVRPGPSYFGLRIIRRGLEPDDRIIINGLVRARPGLPVTPEEGTIEPWPDQLASGAES